MNENQTSTTYFATETRPRDYYPKTRPRLELVDFYHTNPEMPYVKEGYTMLAPGASIVVDAKWLRTALTTVQGGKETKDGTKIASKSSIVKHIIDGFYDYKELAVSGGTKAFMDTPIYKSLQLYAEHYLKMNHAEFKDAWNQKMSSARRVLRNVLSK